MRPIPPRYQPTGVSSDGGMGSVHICFDTILERDVAIKFINNTTHKRRMLDELAALLKMRSKHVVQIYDILKYDDGHIALVQEFINGQDLIEGHASPSSPSEFYKQLWQIASGISDIHSLRVIHRDIKPNNMKTDPEGVIKIFDFGLARDEGPNAMTLGFAGTPGFAAPEQYKTDKFTSAIDTYAFGSTALYLATGDLPQELMTTPPTPSLAGYFATTGLTLAPKITRILDACLAASPENRPPMSDVRDVLARHLLFDSHQAHIVHSGQSSYLNSNNRSVNLILAGIGQIKIEYDGLVFQVTDVQGEVFINNNEAKARNILPESCVVSLGSTERRTNHRQFITFDLSHPEIVL